MATPHHRDPTAPRQRERGESGVGVGWRGRCGAAHEGLNVLDELPLLDLELLRLVRVRARVRVRVRLRLGLGFRLGLVLGLG